MDSRPLIRTCSLTVVLSLAATGTLLAQTTTATIEGSIRDAQGALIPRASVLVEGPTDRRSITAGGDGFYRAVALPVGTYTVTAEASGFATRVLQGIVLVLDRTLTLDITLDLAGQQETVTVVGGAENVDFTTSTTRQVIDSQQIQSIPLNGRNYLDLVLLTPGVVVNDNARADRTNRDTRGSIMGERAGNVSFFIDGVKNNDDFQGGVFQSFTQDAIREFEVIQAGYKAEFGGGSGGVINVITKSGTNDLHGSGFFFARNDALDASNVPAAAVPELQRYNSGFVLGGPISRDRTFFFTAYERLSETREALFVQDIPEVLREGEDFSIVPELTTDRLFGKVNHHLTDAHRLAVGASWSRVENRNLPASATSLPSTSNNNRANTFLGSGAVTSILGNRLLFDTSVSYRDQRYGQNQDIGDGRSFSVTFIDTGRSFQFGPQVASVLSVDQRYLSAREVVSVFVGPRHSMKFGADFTRTMVDGENGPGLVNVLVTTMPNFARYGRESFQILQGSAFINPGDELTRLRNTGVSLFAQDDWRLADGLTVNLGIRYDLDSEFDDRNNVAPRLGLTWRVDAHTAVRASWGLFYDRYRLGIAAAVPEFGGFNSRTVVELNYPRLLADALINFPGAITALNSTVRDPFLLHRHFNIPFDALVTRDTVQGLTGLSPEQFVTELRAFLAGFGTFLPVEFSPATGFLRQDLGAAFQDVIRVAQPFETPYNNTFTLGAERSLPAGVVVGGTYVHREIRNILGLRLTNLAFESRTRGGAITTDGGPIQRTYGSWYDGDYDALIFSVSKHFARRSQFQANYTYARGEDNLLNSNLAIGLASQGGGSVPTDNLDLEVDRGNSDLLVPHTFIASGVVGLPFDIDVSGVFRATSGVFFSAAGPPVDYDGDGIATTRPRSTERNAFAGPGSVNLDMRVEKKFRFGSRYVVSALIESFNVTNARNPGLIDNAWIGGAPVPTFGEVRVPVPGREVQIGVRFEF